MIDRESATALAAIALRNVATEYPYKLDQVLAGDRDVRPPRDLHPVFHSSYDWHSSVHMHWTLLRLLRLFPDHPHADSTRRQFNERLTAQGIRGELATLAEPHRSTFERPYGWAWVLKLAAELHRLAIDDADARKWSDALTPLAQALADRFIEYLPLVAFPTRAGTHGNSAFALMLALDYCETLQHRALHRLIAERANLWFGRDRRYPADYEPSGEDFLSGGMVEAALMCRVIDGCSFADWWTRFEPDPNAMGRWLQPVEVSDSDDPKIVHLHGLNLSRAWCWQQLLHHVASELQPLVRASIDRHLKASLATATQGAYVGTHWLASFALLATTKQAGLMPAPPKATDRYL
ncbi:MAG: DUF2891 domain-containing protein [Pseudomonadota bacterium]|nr:DUF2891 domain-containing protein [Pseudomonadota bacterium]